MRIFQISWTYIQLWNFFNPTVEFQGIPCKMFYAVWNPLDFKIIPCGNPFRYDEWNSALTKMIRSIWAILHMLCQFFFCFFFSVFRNKYVFQYIFNRILCDFLGTVSNLSIIPLSFIIFDPLQSVKANYLRYIVPRSYGCRISTDCQQKFFSS